MSCSSASSAIERAHSAGPQVQQQVGCEQQRHQRLASPSPSASAAAAAAHLLASKTLASLGLEAATSASCGSSPTQQLQRRQQKPLTSADEPGQAASLEAHGLADTATLAMCVERDANRAQLNQSSKTQAPATAAAAAAATETAAALALTLAAKASERSSGNSELLGGGTQRGRSDSNKHAEAQQPKEETKANEREEEASGAGIERQRGQSFSSPRQNQSAVASEIPPTKTTTTASTIAVAAAEQKQRHTPVSQDIEMGEQMPVAPTRRQPQRKVSVFSYNGFPNIQLLDQQNLKARSVSFESGPQEQQQQRQLGAGTTGDALVAKQQLDGAQQQAAVAVKTISLNSSDGNSARNACRSMRLDTLGSTGSSRASSCDEPTIAALSSSPLTPTSSGFSSASSSTVCGRSAISAPLGQLAQTDGQLASRRRKSSSGSATPSAASSASTSSIDSVGCPSWPAAEKQAQIVSAFNVTDQQQQSELHHQQQQLMEHKQQQQQHQAAVESPFADRPALAPPFESIKVQLKRNSMPNAQLIQRHIDKLISQNEAIIDNWNLVSIRSYNSSREGCPSGASCGIKRLSTGDEQPAMMAATAAALTATIATTSAPLAQCSRPMKRLSTMGPSANQHHQSLAPILSVGSPPSGESTTFATTLAATSASRHQQLSPTTPCDSQQQQTNFRLKQLEGKRSYNLTKRSPMLFNFAESANVISPLRTGSLLMPAADFRVGGLGHEQSGSTQHAQLPTTNSSSSSSSIPSSPKATPTQASEHQFHQQTNHHNQFSSAAAGCCNGEISREGYRFSQDPVQLENAIQNLSLKKREDEVQQHQHQRLFVEPTSSGENHITAQFDQRDQQQAQNLILSQQQHHQQQQRQRDDQMAVVALLMERHRQSLVEHEMINLENQAALLRQQQQQQQLMIEQQQQHQQQQQQQQLEQFRLAASFELSQQQQLQRQQEQQRRLSEHQFVSAMLPGGSSVAASVAPTDAALLAASLRMHQSLADKAAHQQQQQQRQQQLGSNTSSLHEHINLLGPLNHQQMQAQQQQQSVNVEQLAASRNSNGSRTYLREQQARESELLQNFLATLMSPNNNAPNLELMHNMQHGAEMLTHSLDSATPSHRCDTCDIAFWTRDLLNYHLMTQCAPRSSEHSARPVAFNFSGPNNFDSQLNAQGQHNNLLLSKSVSPPIRQFGRADEAPDRRRGESHSGPVAAAAVTRLANEHLASFARQSSILKQQLLTIPNTPAVPHESLPFKKRKISEPNMRH